MAKVELIYSAQDKSCIHLQFEYVEGISVSDLIYESKIWTSHPETKDMPLGIFSKPASLDTLLKPGDRIEIYRPLSLDPKENRRQKAKKRT